MSYIGGRGDDLQKNVARIGDIPYWTAPPMQFNLTQSAPLTLGQYPYTAVRTPMGNIKNLNESTLIEFYDMTFSADIPELDYQAALQLAGGGTSIPQFSMFLSSERNAPTLQDPIILNKYFTGQKYLMLIEPKQTPNVLTGFFRGTLQQTVDLAGITAINLTFQFYAQQITDEDYIAEVKRGYPRTGYKLGGQF